MKKKAEGPQVTGRTFWDVILDRRFIVLVVAGLIAVYVLGIKVKYKGEKLEISNDESPRPVAPAGSRTVPEPGTQKGKVPVHIGIVLNGDIFYTREIHKSFTTTLDELLSPTSYDAHYEWATGYPKREDFEKNRDVFTDLLARFPEKPDYLVTVGTQVSEYAYQHYHDEITQIFVAVTDPISSGLVKTYEKDPGRVHIAGTVYDVPISQYVDFFATVFPGKRIAYVFSPSYRQDTFFLDKLTRSVQERGSPIYIVPIEVSKPELTAQQLSSADVFFGRQFVTLNLPKLIASAHKPFVAADASNVSNGAVLSMSTDAAELGEMAARDIVYKNIVEGVSLADLRILVPTRVKIGVNRRVARDYGISIPRSILSKAQVVIDK